MTTISVIIPTYNRAEMVSRCVASVLAADTAGCAAGVGTNILFAGTFPDIDDIVSLTNADLKKYNIEKQFNRRVQS